jgi:hypothetical protein
MLKFWFLRPTWWFAYFTSYKNYTYTQKDEKAIDNKKYSDKINLHRKKNDLYSL